MLKIKSLSSPCLVVVLTLTALPTLAHAQAAAPQFAAAIPGLCIMGRDGVLGGSKAGQAGSARLRQFQQQITTELSPERAAIVAENNALQAGRATLTPAVLQQRAGALQERARKFNELDQMRAAQLERTRLTVEQQIANVIAPAMAPIIARQKCAVVLDRRSAFGANPAMDITNAVVVEVDKLVAPTQFNLATPDQVRAGK